MYGQEILDVIKYQTDLQFGLRVNPVDINDTSTHTAPTGFFYYGLMADAAANVVIASAKDLKGNAILAGFIILAGQRLDGAFSELVLTSGRLYTQLAPSYNAYYKIQ